MKWEIRLCFSTACLSEPSSFFKKKEVSVFFLSIVFLIYFLMQWISYSLSMDNLIALILIHVLLPFTLILLILELMQPLLLTRCLICFYNYEMDSYSSPARELSTGLSESSPLVCDAAVFLYARGVWSQLGLVLSIRYQSSFHVSALTLAGQGCPEWAVLGCDFECWVNHSVILVGRDFWRSPVQLSTSTSIHFLWSRWLLLLNNLFSIVWDKLLEV